MTRAPFACDVCGDERGVHPVRGGSVCDRCLSRHGVDGAAGRLVADGGEEKEPGADGETVTAEVWYAADAWHIDADLSDDSERFDLARDLRFFGTDAFSELGIDPDRALSEAYVRLGETELPDPSEGEGLTLKQTGELLGDVRDRCSGRSDPAFGYVGERHRSLGVGDVIVLDGVAHMVDRIGFTELSGTPTEPSADGVDGELVTDGGRDLAREERAREPETPQRYPDEPPVRYDDPVPEAATRRCDGCREPEHPEELVATPAGQLCGSCAARLAEEFDAEEGPG